MQHTSVMNLLIYHEEIMSRKVQNMVMVKWNNDIMNTTGYDFKDLGMTGWMDEWMDKWMDALLLLLKSLLTMPYIKTYAIIKLPRIK